MLGNYSRQFAVLCDATKLLLKVALNTITLTLNTIYIDALSYNIYIITNEFDEFDSNQWCVVLYLSLCEAPGWLKE
jgi:hypothetical protein